MDALKITKRVFHVRAHFVGWAQYESSGYFIHVTSMT